jgi:selenocysteine-specific elongation factor
MSPRSLGFVRHGENPDVRLMIGTAGHVDHGKTCLVRLLTGCETDRLKAEKERGLSIELGFAPCSLGRNIAAGIVDVPGHEHFIKNMVAGAAGIDMAILVIAADDGVMPQTIEHLQIMQFLGVEHGMIALTKIDLVPKERVEDVKHEIEVLVDGTFLEGVPVCPVSSVTGEGFDFFYNTLVKVAGRAERSQGEGIFRMPVERTFSPPGHGTVATGIPTAGTISLGDEIEVRPGGAKGRVRGMQRFLRDAERGGAGQCLALNLAGIGHEAVERGHVITRPGYVKACRYLQVALTASHDLAAPLRSGEEIRLHTGTLDVQGTLILCSPEWLARRERGFGAVQVAAPIAAAPTDRFVIRRNSPSVTVAGGVVLRTAVRKPRGTRAALAEELKQRWDSFGTLESRFEYQFRHAGPAGGLFANETVESLVSDDEGRRMAEALVKEGLLIPCGGTGRYLHRTGLERATQLVRKTVEKHVADNPASFGPSLADLSSALRLPADSVRTAVDHLVEDEQMVVREDRVGPPERIERLGGRRGELAERIERIYRDGRFSTPRPDELPEMLGTKDPDIEQILDYLCQNGTLTRLGKKVVFHREWMDEAERLVVAAIEERGTLDSADFKTMIGSSRKYALAILDHFDTIHITQRSGNFRKLHPAYVRKQAKSTKP